MDVNWHQITERALRKPQRGPGGENMPRPVMYDEFAVYVGCHFGNADNVLKDRGPVWHVSLNMHSNRRYLYQEWAATHGTAAQAIVEDVFSHVGEGLIMLLVSKGLVMNCARAMKPFEIAVAEAFLPERKESS